MVLRRVSSNTAYPVHSRVPSFPARAGLPTVSRLAPLPDGATRQHKPLVSLSRLSSSLARSRALSLVLCACVSQEGGTAICVRGSSTREAFLFLATGAGAFLVPRSGWSTRPLSPAVRLKGEGSEPTENSSDRGIFQTVRSPARAAMGSGVGNATSVQNTVES